MAIIHEEIKAKIEQHRLWIQSDGEEGAIANLRDASLHNADLSSANLSSANLSFANLHHADLRSADLQSANLSFANLSFADLSSADLSSTNLNYANLSSADLSFADLSSTNLNYADLSSTNLNCADLSSANLHYAIGNMREVKSMHFELVSVVWYCDAEGEIMVCVGGQRNRLQEWKMLNRDSNVVPDGDPGRWKYLTPILWHLIEAYPPVPWKKKSEVRV
ncbi:MAG: pentapeptide repeat-containing protein [Leptolyngbya sp. Prado105]|jgi:hypothetical protein|nr:pentapeptide repeat-containing protein [Leptolyngbya sp. Prado105]